MKKLVALLLSLCLLGSVAFAAELNWADAEETASQIEGGFQDLAEVNAKIWTPAVLKAVELTDEDKENGYIAYFTTEDESAAVAVQYVDVEGMTLEQYEAELKNDASVSDIEAGTVNGIPALSYMIKEKDTAAVAFTTEQGYILEVSCAPISDEGFAATAAFIISSIQSK